MCGQSCFSILKRGPCYQVRYAKWFALTTFISLQFTRADNTCPIPWQAVRGLLASEDSSSALCAEGQKSCPSPMIGWIQKRRASPPHGWCSSTLRHSLGICRWHQCILSQGPSTEYQATCPHGLCTSCHEVMVSCFERSEMKCYDRGEECQRVKDRWEAVGRKVSRLPGAASAPKMVVANP